MSNIVEIHCADFAEKAVVLAYLQHLPDIYKQYQDLDVVESNGNHLEEDEKRTKIFLNKKS
jgi:hypothetical protein